MLWPILQGVPGLGWQKEEHPHWGWGGEGRGRAEWSPTHSGGFPETNSGPGALPGYSLEPWCLEPFPSVLGSRVGQLPPMRERHASRRGWKKKMQRKEVGAGRQTSNAGGGEGRGGAGGGGWPSWHQPPEWKPRSHRNSGGPRHPQINGFGCGAIMGFLAAGSLLNSLFWFTLD